MKTKKLSLVILSLLAVMFLTIGAIFMAPKFDVVRAEGEAIVVEDNFRDITTSNSYYEKYNMQTNNGDKGDEKMGYIPVKEWGAHVQTTDGYMTYKIKSDSGFVFDSLSIEANVGIGHEGGLYYWQTALQSDPNYVWPHANSMAVLNFYIYVSADNENWTPALYSFAEGSLNAGNIKEQTENNIVNVVKTFDTSKIPSSNELYIKFYFEHPENSELPVTPYHNLIAYDKVGLMFESVKISGSQAQIPSTISIFDDFNSLTESKDFVERVNMISEGNLGHPTYGFVPSTSGWDGYCYLADYSYLTYKLQATKGCYIKTFDIDLYATLCHWGSGEDWSKASVKIQASYDNVTYFDLYDLRADEGAVDTWIDGNSYYGAKGQGCLNGAGYLDGNLSGMTGKPDTTTIAPGADVRYLIDKTYDNSVIKKTDTLYIRLACINQGDQKKSLAQCPTRLHNVSMTIEQEALAEIVINDDMTNNTKKTPIAIKNMISSGNSFDMYNTGYGWVPAAIWGDPAQNIGSGSLTYLLMADSGAVLDDVSFSMVYRMFMADSSKHANGAANIIVSVSTDGKNYVTAFDAFEVNGIDTSSEDKYLNNLDLSAYAKGSPVLYIMIDFICPEEASLNLGKIPVTIKGVSAKASQKFAAGESLSTYILFGDKGGAAPSGNGLVSSSGVVDGNKTFALIPTSTWGGTVNTGAGELIYKVSAGEGKKLGALTTFINAEVMNGGNIILSISEDNVTYTEMYDLIGSKNPATGMENAFAYLNPYKWHRGAAGEERNYQRIAVNFGAFTENLSDVYVKIQVIAPVESVGLQNVKVKVFSIEFNAPITTREVDKGYISYITFAGENSAANPKSFVVGESITLENATKVGTNFIGWYDNPTFQGEPITTLDTTTVKDYKLYAKYDASIIVDVTLINGDGLVSINGELAQTKLYAFELGNTVVVSVANSNEKYLYSFVVDGVDTAISSEYKISNIRNNVAIVITYSDRAAVSDYFNVVYDNNGNSPSAWKKGAYDFGNLKVISFDSDFALGVANTSTYGYITYKIVAPNGKLFEAMQLTLRGKLSNFLGEGRTENYYVDYYIGFEDGMQNNYANFELLYQGEIGLNNTAYNKIHSFPIIEEIEGKSEVYIQIRIKSASANWIGIRELTFGDITYQSVQVKINYGSSYVEYHYNQLSGVAFDSSLINIKQGFVWVDSKIYTDADFSQEFDTTTLIYNDLDLYVKVANGQISYVLNGGVNAAENKAYYESFNGPVEIADPTCVGKTFAGWYLDENFDTYFAGIVEGRTGDITLYAKWIDNLLVKITSASLTLGKDITMNYYALVAGEYETVLMRFTMNGIAVEVAPVLDGYSFRFDFINIAPQHMGDNIKAELLVDGVVVAEKDNYSILTYCNNMLANNPSSELATLIADTLEYGAAAQCYVGYKTDSLVNEGIVGKTEFVPVSTTDKLKEKNSVVEGFDIYSAGVYFYYSNNVYVKFNAGEGFKVTINDVDATENVQAIDNGYILYSDMISATNFDKVYVFKLYDGETLVQTFNYSIKSFVYTFQNNNNSVARIAKSLYNYGLSANAYIQSLEA